MCGISFYCSLKINPIAELKESINRISHRGPDDFGFFYKQIAKYFIGVGHNRLSILDLSASGKQPMQRQGITIAYNGEVYNHQILRKNLESRQYNFQGHSDTEIVLVLFKEYGIDSFSMLNGMFAFIIVDEPNSKIYLVRDRLGIKPLYYFNHVDGLFVSSEIRGLKAFSMVNCAVNPHHVFEFFNQGFLYEPSTGYTNIHKLNPAHYLEFNLKNGAWNLINYKTTISYPTSTSLDEKLRISMQEQTISDVTLGTFFSGGTDSGLIASLSNNNELFFAKYHNSPTPSKHDHDLEFATAIAKYLKKNLDITEMSAECKTPDELIQSVDFVASNTEELISDYTFWATYQIALAAKNKNYKVMLSGMGGDELFAGYPRNLVLKKHQLIKMLYPFFVMLGRFNFIPKKFDKKFERLLSYCKENHWPTAYSRLLGYFSREDLQALFPNINLLEIHYREKLDTIANKFPGNPKDKVKLAQFFDLSGFLSHNLTIADKAAMLASIELRVPLLYEVIVEHALTLSSKQLMQRNQLKYPLKQSLLNLLPKQLIKRPKIGFNPPLDGLINTIGLEKLRNEMIYAKKFINFNAITFLLNQHFSGAANNTYKLWQLLYFSRWVKCNTV